MSAVSSPSGTRGKALAAKSFGVVWVNQVSCSPAIRPGSHSLQLLWLGS